MPQRDPRVDPRPGDVVSNGREQFYVTEIADGVVYYTDAPPVEVQSIRLGDWRAYSKNDAIVNVAPAT